MSDPAKTGGEGSGAGDAGASGGASGGSPESVIYTTEELAAAPSPEVKTRMEKINNSITLGEKAIKSQVQLPEKYELKPIKDSLLGEAHLAEVASFAKENGLTQKQAEAFLGRETSVVKSFSEGQKALFEKTALGWVEEAKKDKVYGGEKFAESCELGSRFLKKFADEETTKLLESSKLGQHPAFWRLFAKLGGLLKEDTLHLPGSQGGEDGTKKTLGGHLYAKQ